MDNKNTHTVSTLALRPAATTLNQPYNNINNITIQTSGPAHASNESLVADLTRLVIDYMKVKYGVPVEQIKWAASRVQARLRAGELVIALVRPTDNAEPRGEKLVGCIRIKKFSLTTGGFRTLIVDPAYRNTGLEWRLIHFAEKRCRDDLGLAVMRQEFFSRKQRTKEPPKYLSTLGYVMSQPRDAEEAYPELKTLLDESVDCYAMEKKLVE
ncbi:hypothetical protein F4680DRAFT_447655 [Xylaria scruposa]|nr:hypothetical protein F4680DRAFT_447655 [Xylaria scruposa]